MTAIADFFEDYDDLVGQLSRARHQDFAPLLKRLIALFDGAPPEIANRIEWLRTLFPYQRVETEVVKRNRGMGPDQLNWPETLEPRLSAQLNTFQNVAFGKQEAWQFAHRFFYSRSNNADDILGEMVGRLFEFFTADMRKYLERNLERPIPGMVPAAERLVPLDHNSKGYADLIDDFDKLDEAVRVTNSGEPEIKAVARAELNAGRALLSPTNIRRASATVILSLLGWIAVQFADAAIQPLAAHAIALLKALFPWLPT